MMALLRKGLTVGRVNLIRFMVIEACREKNVAGPVCWIGIRETRTSKEPEYG